MGEMNSLLTIKNLNLIFQNDDRSNHVLRGIDLDIKQGEIVGLVGESGSGKSVTGLALCGLLPKKSAQLNGSIVFQQEGKETELIGLSEKSFNNIRGRQISMIFQEPMTALNPLHTVGKQIAQVCLHAGANDWGSIMIEENVVSAAGARFRFTADGIQQAIREAGFVPQLRNQQYEYRELPQGILQQELKGAGMVVD